MYTYRWVSLLVWLYFTEGVVRATSDRGLSARCWPASRCVLCLVLFAACALHVRWRLHRARARGRGMSDALLQALRGRRRRRARC